MRRKRVENSVLTNKKILDKVTREPLSQLLSEVIILAKDLKETELEQWARLKFTGYYEKKTKVSTRCRKLC